MKTKKDILQLEKTLSKLENLNSSFDYLKLNLASPKRIKSWSERILPMVKLLEKYLKRKQSISGLTNQKSMDYFVKKFLTNSKLEM